MTGAVTDASGAFLPNARVSVRNQATKVESVVTTNESGNFNVPNIQPGDYTVRVEASGFQSYNVSNVHVDASIGKRVDVALKVGDTSSTVTVEASANTVQTESAVVGQLVTQEQVKSIQLNGRNPLYLAQLEPGVVRNAPMANFNFGLDNGLNIGGARATESLITLDGAPATRTRGNGTSVGVADVDATSQVQILTNSYQAEYGRTDGGQVRIVPKSGTSEFHGTAYEYLRNTFFNANTWQRKLPSNALRIRSRPPGFNFNQFGYNVNGPVSFKGFNKSKSHLFFLFGQEYIRYNNEDTVFDTAPTALMRQGNFSELLGPNIFYPTGSTVVSPKTGVAYAGNIISPGDLSPNGLALLNAFPVPNASAPTYNWADASKAIQTQRKDTYVFDFIPADAHRFRLTVLDYAYYSYSPHYGGFNRNPQIFNRPNQIGVLHYTWTASPTLINELVVSAATDHVFISIDTSSGLYNRNNYGINYPFLYSAATKTIPNKIPTIQFLQGGFTTLDGGPYPSHSGGIVYSASDNMTKVLGNHTIKAGFNFEYTGENNFDQISVSSTTPGATNNQNGYFRFSDTHNNLTNANNVPVTTTKAVANAAVGLFDTYGEIGQRSYTLYRSTSYEGFVQDQWRATPHLVIEAGLRYSIYNPFYAKWGNQSVFNASVYNPANAATVNPITDVVTGGDRYNGVVIPGSGFPSSAQGHVDPAILSGFNGLFHGFSNTYSPTVKTDIQPRVGLTYQLQPGMVFRAGGGRYVQRLGISDSVFTGGNAPFQPSSTVTNGSVDAPGGVGTNNFPFNYSSQAYNYPSPEAYNWNVTMEQEIPAMGVFTLAYAGRRGIHLEELLNVNQLQPGTTTALANKGINPDALRTFKGFSNINQDSVGGASFYNALQANLRRRLTKGLLFGVAYTWSKSTDFGSSLGTNIPNAFDKSIYYGPSDFDRRHVFVTNFVYNISEFDHSSFAANRILFGRWQFSGTLQAQTGGPLNVSTGNDYAGVGPGSGTQLFLHTAPVTVSKGFANQTGTAKWFDTSVWAAPAAGTFAPRGSRNQIFGPGFQSYSAALNKTIPLVSGSESKNLLFRAEAFNLANHPTADNPNTNPTSSNFGYSRTKGGTYGADRQFQFSLRVAF